MMNHELRDCDCRCSSVMKEQLIQMSQGVMDALIWVECKCGMRTVGKILGWDGYRSDCEEAVRSIWNRDEIKPDPNIKPPQFDIVGEDGGPS